MYNNPQINFEGKRLGFNNRANPTLRNRLKPGVAAIVLQVAVPYLLMVNGDQKNLISFGPPHTNIISQ